MTDQTIIILKSTAGELICGELINTTSQRIGDLLYITSDEITIKNPHIIFFDQQRNLGMAPYLPLFEGNALPFNKLSIDVYGIANDQVNKSYVEATGGLALPLEPKIILE